MENVPQISKKSGETLPESHAEFEALKKQDASEFREANRTSLPEIGLMHVQKTGSPISAMALTRQELLNAIDFEISQRESSTTRHGITVWGIVVAVIGLVWSSLNEVLETVHSWPEVILVLFVAHLALGLIATPWLKTLNTAIAMGGALRRGGGPKDFLSVQGMDPSLIPYYMLETFLLIMLCIYLGFEGFWGLCIFGGTFYLILFLFLAAGYTLCHVRIPITVSFNTCTKKSLWSSIFAFGGIGIIFFIGIQCIAALWPIQKSDIRLGVMLAGLMLMFGFSLRLMRAPIGIAPLRSLRSKVGLGLIEVPTAKREVETILLGSPDENYVLTKAESIIVELNSYIEICNRISSQVERFAELAERLKASPQDQKMVHEVVSEFRSFAKHMVADIHGMENHMGAATKLRSQLTVRMEAAKAFLGIQPRTIADIMSRVNAHRTLAEQANRKMRENSKKREPYLKYLFEAQRGIFVPPKLTYSDLFTALFRD